jgi:hypothetical protein
MPQVANAAIVSGVSFTRVAVEILSWRVESPCTSSLRAQCAMRRSNELTATDAAKAMPLATRSRLTKKVFCGEWVAESSDTPCPASGATLGSSVCRASSCARLASGVTHSAAPSTTARHR